MADLIDVVVVGGGIAGGALGTLARDADRDGNKAAADRLDEPTAATIRNPDATSMAAAELGAR